eukprot:TRINITY_DN9830_c0_g1_i1.p1 TRINITY_DN9830_c0_g1~~TRINITY_DN9830_c0_g1_i1.p1  ORF type:complete len:587 (-),score=125.95 TRINITY_DN9830_c0_g1_i1:13-1773(-)
MVAAELVVLLLGWASFLVPGEEAPPSEAANETYHDLLIDNQSFNKTVACPPHQHCRFVCRNAYNPCLNTTFQCTRNNSCTLECASDASCSFSRFDCSEDSRCVLNCTGQRSCSFVREFCGVHDGNWSNLPGNCLAESVPFNLVSVDATIGLATSVAFATLGYTILNMVAIPHGSIQFLVKSFPDDNHTQTKLFSIIDQYVRQLVLAISTPPLTSYPKVIWQKTHPLIITATFPDFNQFLMTVLTSSFLSLSDFILLEKVDFFQYNNTIHVQLNLNTTESPLEIINIYETLLAVNVFRYPNDSFVKVSSYQVGSRVFSMVQLSEWNCSLPGPFYGTACIGKVWNSFGEQVVSYEDLIANLLDHYGSLIITNILNILEGTLSAQNNLFISNGVVLIVNSTISVGDDIHFSGGTLQIDVSSNISANNIIINEGNSIIINLDQQTYLNYLSTGNITIMPFKANNVSGDFSQITFQGPNGTLDGCASSTHQGNTYFVTLSDCNNQISTNTPVLIGAIVGGVLSLAIVISFVYILVRLYNFQKSMKALEDTPPTQEETTKVTKDQKKPKSKKVKIDKTKDTTVKLESVLNNT